MKSLTQVEGKSSPKGTMLFEYEIEAPVEHILGSSPLSELLSSLSHELDLDLIDARIRVRREGNQITVKSLVVKGFV
ncbi:MAG: hypothetical protein DRO05_01830 [Thermoproteota archaeon]|nr:MAG: hypothetical protein DRO05_01830 [Candidatus Korarchaeota archaeon]